MNRRRLLKRISQGAVQNISFADFRNLIEGFGFQLSRTQGSHHIFVHVAVAELLNLQDIHGEAKPYQIRQALRLVERYNLTLEDEI